jgi:hypothetical protein
MTDPDEIARCAAARRARREAYHCGACGRPYKSQIGAAECDCPPIKLRMDVLGMSLAVESFQQACAAAVPILQEAVRGAKPDEEAARRIANALMHGYRQDGAWWIHPDGTRTSADGLPRLDDDVPPPSGWRDRPSLL